MEMKEGGGWAKDRERGRVREGGVRTVKSDASVLSVTTCHSMPQKL